MTHAIHFFCPGRPSADIAARYDKALAPLGHVNIIWHTPSGLASAFTNMVRSWRPTVLDYLRSREPEDTATRSLIAFSAGYGAIREIIGPTENRKDIDAIVLLDALHAGLDPDGTARDSQLIAFAGYATRAKHHDGSLLWVAHTDVPTYGYASTTDSAEELVRLAHGEGGQFQVHAFDREPPQRAKAEHAGALTKWGPGYVAEALVPHLGALALRRPTRLPDGEELTESWLDPLLSPPERAVLWSLAQQSLGGIETDGRNAGPIIASYFRWAKRRDSAGTDRPIGIRRGEWCAVGLNYAERQCLLDGEVPLLPYRVSGIEMQQDAQRAKRWRPVDLMRPDGPWQPTVGDVAVFVRPAHQSPKQTWKRHVSRVSVAPGPDGYYSTIDANQGDRWKEVGRSVRDPDLLGFIECTPREPEQALEALSPEVWAQMVQTSEDVARGRYGLDHALAGLLPQDLVA